MKLLPSLLAAAAAASICAPAAADITLSPIGGGGFAGSFTQAANGPFVDYFNFTPVAITGLVSVVLRSVSGPVTFFAASLNDQPFSFFDPAGSTFAFQANVTADAPLTLAVFGGVLDANGVPAGDGVYSGTINVAVPVPEPQTWALLFAGLGALGFASRYRRQDALRAS